MSADRFADLISQLSGLAGGEAFPLLCSWSADHLSVSGTGLSLIVDDEHRGCLGASDDGALRIEELQFRTGEGPCLDAHRSGHAVVEADLARTSRWPMFTPEALSGGIAAVGALPLRVGSAGFGALDLYRDEPGSMTPGMLADAQVVADIATALVLDFQAGATHGLDSVIEDLFEHRVVVHQATGMASVQLGVSLSDALVAIRAHAFATERTVRAVAAAIIDRTVRLEP